VTLLVREKLLDLGRHGFAGIVTGPAHQENEHGKPGHAQNRAERRAESPPHGGREQHDRHHRQRRLPAHHRRLHDDRRQQGGKPQDERQVHHVGADQVADGETFVAACRGQAGHQELRRAGTQPDDHHADHHGRHAQAPRDPARAEDEVVGGHRQNHQTQRGQQKKTSHATPAPMPPAQPGRSAPA
jgi:hypothetical protein